MTHVIHCDVVNLPCQVIVAFFSLFHFQRRLFEFACDESDCFFYDAVLFCSTTVEGLIKKPYALKLMCAFYLILFNVLTSNKLLINCQPLNLSVGVLATINGFTFELSPLTSSVIDDICEFVTWTSRGNCITARDGI